MFASRNRDIAFWEGEINKFRVIKKLTTGIKCPFGIGTRRVSFSLLLFYNKVPWLTEEGNNTTFRGLIIFQSELNEQEPVRNTYRIRLVLSRSFDAVSHSGLNNNILFFSNISSSSFNIYSRKQLRLL